MDLNQKQEECEVFCTSLPVQSTSKSTQTNNADAIKEVRNMFLEKYLENNKIGRKSKCNFKSKSKSISNINYFNASIQRKIINKSNNNSPNSQNHDLFCNKFNIKNNYINDNDNDNFNVFSVSYDSTFLSTVDVFDNNWNFKNSENSKTIKDQQQSKSLFYKNKTEKVTFQNDYLDEDIFQIDEMKYLNIIQPESYVESSFSDFDETTYLNNNLNDFRNSKKIIGRNLHQIPVSSESSLINGKNEDLNDSKYANINDQCSFTSVNELISIDFNFD